MGHDVTDKYEYDSTELLDAETIRDLTRYFVERGDPDGDDAVMEGGSGEPGGSTWRAYRSADEARESMTKKEILLYQKEILAAAWKAYGDKVGVWEELYFRRRGF